MLRPAPWTATDAFERNSVRRLRHATIALLVSFSTFGGSAHAEPAVPSAGDPTVQAAPAATATLAGTVIDAATNRPLGGVTVLATRNAATYTTTSAPDGTFTLALPPGVYDVNASKGGFQGSQFAEYAVAPGVTSMLRIPIGRIAATGTIRRTARRTRSSIRRSASNSLRASHALRSVARSSIRVTRRCDRAGSGRHPR